MKELILIIKEQANKSAALYTDGFKAYDSLSNYGYKRHYRVKHSENEFFQGHNHINRIENFVAYVKFVCQSLSFALKECEFRCNFFAKKDTKKCIKYLLKLLEKIL